MEKWRRHEREYPCSLPVKQEQKKLNMMKPIGLVHDVQGFFYF